MDKSCTIIRIDHPTANEFECELHCDALTAIKAASLIIIHVLENIPEDMHELAFRMLKDYVYQYKEE